MVYASHVCCSLSQLLSRAFSNAIKLALICCLILHATSSAPVMSRQVKINSQQIGLAQRSTAVGETVCIVL